MNEIELEIIRLNKAKAYKPYSSLEVSQLELAPRQVEITESLPVPSSKYIQEIIRDYKAKYNTKT
jgi:hypothetical protein